MALDIDQLPATDARNRYHQLVFQWHCAKSPYAGVLFPAELHERAGKALRKDDVTEDEFIEILKEINGVRVPPAEPEMPWETLGWDDPTPQIARIIRFMWNRDQASCDALIADVWGNDKIRDNTICAARSRANDYLGKNRHARTLEKVRGNPVVRWA